MKLYSLPGSRYGTRVLIQIHAKGIPIDVEMVSYPIRPEFAAINPLMMVPVLDTGETLLPESSIICDYLEAVSDGPSLVPSDPLERARMQLLIRLFEQQYDPWMLRLYERMRDPAAPEATVIAMCQDKMRAGLDRIAEHLDAGPYAVGGALTLADCALMPPLLQAQVFLPALGFDDPVSAHEPVKAWFDATRTVDHVREVLDRMEAGLRRIYLDRE